MPDIENLQVHHIVADLWDYLRDGEHEYAFEWDRSEVYEDALRDLLSLWLFEAYRPQSWENEERRLRWLSFGYIGYGVREEEAFDQVFEEAQGASGGTGFLS